jgi:hypothetical protein
MVAQVVTVNDVLDGHVALDIECLDRIYLNAYVPVLQTSAQVVAFLSGHLGFPFPSPVLFRQLGDRFRRAVLSFADANDIAWVKFGKGEAKLEVMAPHLARQAETGRSGVAAIGVAQEFQRVWTAYEGKTSAGALCQTLLAATGFTNKNLRVLIAGLLGSAYTPGQMTYDLRRLRLGGLIRRLPHTNRYTLTDDGIRIAVFYTKVYNRLLVPLTAANQPQAPPELRAALSAITRHVDTYAQRARLPAAA